MAPPMRAPAIRPPAIPTPTPQPRQRASAGVGVVSVAAARVAATATARITFLIWDSLQDPRSAAADTQRLAHPARRSRRQAQYVRNLAQRLTPMKSPAAYARPGFSTRMSV